MGSGKENSVRARGVRTQIIVLRRVAKVIIVTIGIAIMLSQFEPVRKLGMSLLASAGVAGVVLGLAAQKSIATILSGIQLAITQPVRIGDTVIIEGEWGTIEEINLTFVVVKVWDQRRLVIPIGDLLSKPFQNWTRVSPELLGTIEWYVDYSTPIDLLNKKIREFAEESEFWDRRVANVQVTACSEKTILARGLISAKDASDQWNLRVEVRTKMINWLQKYQKGKYLPKLRISDNA